MVGTNATSIHIAKSDPIGIVRCRSSLCHSTSLILSRLETMSEEKITGFAALMRERRRKQQKQEEEESVEVKPVIRETTLTCIPSCSSQTKPLTSA